MLDALRFDETTSIYYPPWCFNKRRIHTLEHHAAKQIYVLTSMNFSSRSY